MEIQRLNKIIKELSHQNETKDSQIINMKKVHAQNTEKIKQIKINLELSEEENKKLKNQIEKSNQQFELEFKKLREN